MIKQNSQKLIAESSLRRLILKEIKQQRLNEHASRMLEESKSKNAIIGSIITMLAGAGLLTKDMSIDQIKQKAQSMIGSTTSAEQPKKSVSEVLDMFEKFCQQNQEPAQMIIHYIYSTSPLSSMFWGKSASQHAAGFEKTIDIVTDSATKNHQKLSPEMNMAKDLELIKKINASIDEKMISALLSLSPEDLKKVTIDQRRYPALINFMDTFKFNFKSEPSKDPYRLRTDDEKNQLRGDYVAKYLTKFKKTINAIEQNTEQTLTWLKDKSKSGKWYEQYKNKKNANK